MNLEDFEKKIYSQHGEDGVTLKIVETVYDDQKNKFFVEFGVESGIQCNTRILREKYQWDGLQMDGGYENHDINLRREFITRENIVDLFQKYNVPKHIHVLCIDIDFNDFYCLQAILKSNMYVVDILICEYNATHFPDEDKVIIYDANGRGDGSNYFGASLLSFVRLTQQYNYSLVYCDKLGVDCYFIRNEIIQSRNLSFKNVGDIQALYQSPKYSNGPRGGHPQDSLNRNYISSIEAMAL